MNDEQFTIADMIEVIQAEIEYFQFVRENVTLIHADTEHSRGMLEGYLKGVRHAIERLEDVVRRWENAT